VDVGDELIDCEAEDKAHSAAYSGSEGGRVQRTSLVSSAAWKSMRPACRSTGGLVWPAIVAASNRSCRRSRPTGLRLERLLLLLLLRMLLWY